MHVVLLYASAKFVAYVAWCFLGLRWAGLRETPGHRILKAFGLGAVRLIIGWIVGMGVGLLTLFLFHNFVAAYFLILVPVRWLEWSAISPFIFKRIDDDEIRAMRIPALSRMWRVGGIVLSCAIDIPFVIGGNGFPSGRVFC
jgi:hypothetical protein